MSKLKQQLRRTKKDAVTCHPFFVPTFPTTHTHTHTPVKAHKLMRTISIHAQHNTLPLSHSMLWQQEHWKLIGVIIHSHQLHEKPSHQKETREDPLQLSLHCSLSLSLCVSHLVICCFMSIINRCACKWNEPLISNSDT